MVDHDWTCEALTGETASSSMSRHETMGSEAPSEFAPVFVCILYPMHDIVGRASSFLFQHSRPKIVVGTIMVMFDMNVQHGIQ